MYLTALLSGAHIIVAVLGFATQMELASKISHYIYGEMAFGISIGIWCQVIVRMGYDRTLSRDIFETSKKEIRSNAVIFESLHTRLVALAIVAISTVIFSLYVKINISVLLIALSNVFIAFDIHPWFDLKGHTPTHIKFHVFGRLIYFAAVWSVLVFFDDISLEQIALFSIISASIPILLQYRFWLKTVGVTFRELLLGLVRWQPKFPTDTKNRLYLLSSTLLALASWRFPDLYLGILGKFQDLAGYSIYLQIMIFEFTILDQILRLYRIKFNVDFRTSEFKVLYKRAFRELLAVSAGLSLTLVIGTYIATRYVLPAHYAWITDLYLGGTIIIFAYGIGGLWSMLLIQNKQEFQYTAGVIAGSVACVASGIPFVYLWGARGAILCAAFGVTTMAYVHRSYLKF